MNFSLRDELYMQALQQDRAREVRTLVRHGQLMKTGAASQRAAWRRLFPHLFARSDAGSRRPVGGLAVGSVGKPG